MVLRVFCYSTYAHVNGGKFKLMAGNCIFLRYTDGVKGYIALMKNHPRTSLEGYDF